MNIAILIFPLCMILSGSAMLTRRQSFAHRRLSSISSVSLSFSSSTDISIYILREIFLVPWRKAARRQHTLDQSDDQARWFIESPTHSLDQAVEPSDAAHVGQPFTAPAGACCAVADPRKRPVWRHAAMGSSPSASVGMASIRGEIRA